MIPIVAAVQEPALPGENSKPELLFGMHCRRLDSRPKSYQYGWWKRGLYMHKLSLMLAGFLIAANTAGAVETNTKTWKQVNNWLVASDPSMGDSCYIATSYDGDIILRMGFYPRGSENMAFVSFGSPDWRSIEADKSYDITMQLDQGRRWPAAAIGFQTDGLKHLVVNFSNVDFIDDFVRRNFLKVSFGGRAIANLSLKDSRRAASEMFKCQEAVNALLPVPDRDSFGEAAKAENDPFAGADGNAADKDPFAAGGAKETSKDPFAM
ncbi:hypothetical protein PYH37_004447 [Sinorhizobium numidicum]|uniref:Uncharacterized protein n=1 Tax=Sinorhizobium numidicum TaxID=680248 RepID=A0ABY8CY83_9HYPH|nr:hypothetical protein [Sinorhizobium numidicum]WEX76168.1 hypothetical protein PYH37_004447 [Sinorhizobium numidicum]WEX82827.1 hypothetical protein PYH38_005159 [Sinorhizobium numidicum]